MYVITRDGNRAGPLHKGGQTVAIYVDKSNEDIEFEQKVLGIAKPDPRQRVADFSYESDALAQMIVEAWTNPEFEKKLLKKENAVPLLAERGFFLSKAHIISEADYHKPGGHKCDTPDEVVLVLPDKSRVDPSKRPLLETAKLLMAVTPNGI